MAKRSNLRRAVSRQPRNNGSAGSNLQSTKISRTFLLGSVPAGNSGFQFTAAIAVYPDEETLLPIARSYSEYKFTSFQVSLVPRCPTSTQGTKWLGFGYSVPFTVGDFAQASSLADFSSTQSYINRGRSRLRPANSSQRWYPVIQTGLTATQLADPNIVQAYLYLGTQGVQSGVTVADIHVRYTVHFRGPCAALSSVGPAAVPRVVRGFPTALATMEDEASAE